MTEPNGNWGGARAGSAYRGRTLLHRVFAGSFRADRHQRLLERDRSLFEYLISEDDPDFECVMGLAWLQEKWQEAEDERQRHKIARVFEQEVRLHFGPAKIRRLVQSAVR